MVCLKEALGKAVLLSELWSNSLRNDHCGALLQCTDDDDYDDDDDDDDDVKETFFRHATLCSL